MGGRGARFIWIDKGKIVELLQIR